MNAALRNLEPYLLLHSSSCRQLRLQSDRSCVSTSTDFCLTSTLRKRRRVYYEYERQPQQQRWHSSITTPFIRVWQTRHDDQNHSCLRHECSRPWEGPSNCKTHLFSFKDVSPGNEKINLVVPFVGLPLYMTVKLSLMKQACPRKA